MKQLRLIDILWWVTDFWYQDQTHVLDLQLQNKMDFEVIACDSSILENIKQDIIQRSYFTFLLLLYSLSTSSEE